MKQLNKALIMISSNPTSSNNISFKDIKNKSIAVKLKASKINVLIIVDDSSLTEEERHALLLIIKYVNYTNLNYRCVDDNLLVKDRIDILNALYPDKISKIRQMAFTGGKIKEFL